MSVTFLPQLELEFSFAVVSTTPSEKGFHNTSKPKLHFTLNQDITTDESSPCARLAKRRTTIQTAAIDAEKAFSFMRICPGICVSRCNRVADTPVLRSAAIRPAYHARQCCL